MASKKPGYFRENWKVLLALLTPLTFLLAGIILLIIYESSYTFRVAYDEWWRDLWRDAPAANAKSVPIIPTVPSYDKKYVSACNVMPDMYVLDSPDSPAPIELRPSIGLEPGADPKAIENRCIAFAKTVAKMQTVSNHRHYAYLCPGTRYVLGNDFGFVPMPNGKGVMVWSGAKNAETIPIPIEPGRQAFYSQWQFYNVGDGCYVVGYSTRRSRALEVVTE